MQGAISGERPCMHPNPFFTDEEANARVRDLDDASQYVGNPSEWETRVAYEDTGTSWVTVVSRGVVTRPRMTASGLCTVFKQAKGFSVFFLATSTPYIDVDKGWDCRTSEWTAVAISTGDVLYV